jgi:hypothetical protein
LIINLAPEHHTFQLEPFPNQRLLLLRAGGARPENTEELLVMNKPTSIIISFGLFFSCSNNAIPNKISAVTNYKWESIVAQQFAYKDSAQPTVVPGQVYIRYDTSTYVDDDIEYFVPDSFRIVNNADFVIQAHLSYRYDDVSMTSYVPNAFVTGTVENNALAIDRYGFFMGDTGVVLGKANNRIGYDTIDGRIILYFYYVNLSVLDTANAPTRSCSWFYADGRITDDSMLALVNQTIKENNYRDTVLYRYPNYSIIKYQIAFVQQ